MSFLFLAADGICGAPVWRIYPAAADFPALAFGYSLQTLRND
jgi:hypothetical protein